MSLPPLPLAADIFSLNSAPANAQKNLTINASFFEIYSGKVYDLLNKKVRLRILEDKKQQVQIVGLAEERVEGVDDVLRLIQQGNKCRYVCVKGQCRRKLFQHEIFITNSRYYIMDYCDQKMSLQV